jgi:hypothetical protein
MQGFFIISEPNQFEWSGLFNITFFKKVKKAFQEAKGSAGSAGN